MLKKELISEVSRKTGATKELVHKVIDSIAEVTLESVRQGGEVMVLGLGKLSISRRGPKKARNIHTGETVTVPPRNAPLFRPSVALTKAANGE